MNIKMNLLAIAMLLCQISLHGNANEMIVENSSGKKLIMRLGQKDYEIPNGGVMLLGNIESGYKIAYKPILLPCNIRSTGLFSSAISLENVIAVMKQEYLSKKGQLGALPQLRGVITIKPYYFNLSSSNIATRWDRVSETFKMKDLEKMSLSTVIIDQLEKLVKSSSTAQLDNFIKQYRTNLGLYGFTDGELLYILRGSVAALGSEPKKAALKIIQEKRKNTNE